MDSPTLSAIGNSSGGKALLLKHALILMDNDFLLTLIENFCKSCTPPKVNDILNSMIVLLDDHYLEILKSFIKTNNHINKQSSHSENDANSFLSYQNVVNKMSSAFLKFYSASVLEKILSTQMSYFTPNIQEFIHQQMMIQQHPHVQQLSQSYNNSGSINNSNGSSSSPMMTRTSVVFNSNGSNSHNNNNNNNQSSTTNGVDSNSNDSGIGLNNTYNSGGSEHTNSSGSRKSFFMSSSFEQETQQCSSSIVNTIFRSIDKFPSQLFQLFELLNTEIVFPEMPDSYSIDLIKKLFFTKLICPILAGLKPPPTSNSSIFSKFYIEISKIVSDIIYDKNTNTKRMVTTQDQVVNFIKNLITKPASLSGSQNAASAGSTTPTLNPSVSGVITAVYSKDEACTYFVHHIKTEINQLDEAFRKSSEKNQYLYSTFKEFLTILRTSSFSHTPLAPSSKGLTFPTLRGKNILSSNNSSNQTSASSGPNGASSDLKVITFNKKWSSDELRHTYNGKSPRKRCLLLEKKFHKTLSITIHVHTDNFMVARQVNIPTSITCQALVHRILHETEFNDLTLSKEEYELSIKYNEEFTTVIVDDNASSTEVVCEPELPLWMYDVDQESTTLIIKPAIKKKITSFNFFIKFIFPSSPVQMNPIILYINPQITPQTILNEKLQKYVSHMDPSHLGFFICNISDENSSSSNNNSFNNNNTCKIPNDCILAGNKISTMDIIECGPRHSYEFELVGTDGNSNNNSNSNNKIILDYDHHIDYITSCLYNVYSQSINSGKEDKDKDGNVIGKSAPFSLSNSNLTPRSLTTSGIRSSISSNMISSLDNNYSLAVISHSNFLPMFLNSFSKLQEYSFNVGDELILTDKTFVSLVDEIGRSNRKQISLTRSDQGSYLSSLNTNAGFCSQSPIDLTISPVKARFRVSWSGMSAELLYDHPASNAPVSFNNTFHYNLTTGNTTSLSSLSIDSPPLDINNNNAANNNNNSANSYEKPLLSCQISNESTYICTTKHDFCINNQVKLCIVGEETPEKLNIYNVMKKNFGINNLINSSSGSYGGSLGTNSGNKIKDSLTSSSSNGDINTDSCISMSDWSIGSEQDCSSTTFKVFYFNGIETYTSIHPLFISPQSIFLITYNPLNVNTSNIEYWLEIIKTKSIGSLVYLVGVSTSSDEKKFVKLDNQKLFRFNNIVDCLNINYKNSKHIKLLSNSLLDTAQQKQFRFKVPLSYTIFKSQCIESSREATQKSKMPISSIGKIKAISRIIGLDPKEIEDALNYLYKSGDILYYKQEGNNEILTDMVFLDSTWMSKLIGSVFALKHQNGMLLIDKIKTAWEDKFPVAIHRSILTLLEKLEIIHHSPEDSSIIVPSLFSEERPMVMRDLWPAKCDSNNEYRRVYEFQFLPKGFFSRLSVRILQSYDPLCIWQSGIVLQPAGQLWGGAAKSDHEAQCFIEYDPITYKLCLVIRDDQNSQLLRSIIDVMSSFILWYFPGRLKNVYVTCTKCLQEERSEPTLFSIDYLEKQASHGELQVTCRGHKVEIYELAFEVTVNSSKFSIIPYEDLKIGPQLGSGSYAVVYRGLWNQSEVAIKILNFDETDTNTEKFREFRNEALITGELHHENTVSLKGVSTNPFCIITELLQFGDLSKFIRHTCEAFSWETVLKLSVDISRGMNFLHQCKPMVVHRDLKSANILIGGSSIDTLVAKVSDFGLSIKPVGKEVKGRKVWNWRWLAPEIMKNQQYTEKIDVYSFGIVLWELISREVPFDEFYDELKWNTILEDKIIKGLRPTIPSECPNPMKELISECWSDDPKKRPSFASIITRLQQMQKTFPLKEKLLFAKVGTNKSAQDLNEAMPPPPSPSPLPLPSHLKNSIHNHANNNSSSSLNPLGGSGGGGEELSSSTSNSPYNSGTFNSSGGALNIIKYHQTIPNTFNSTIHSLLSIITSKGESQMWCGLGDGTVLVINPQTRAVVASTRSADATRIIGLTLVKKSTTKSSSPFGGGLNLTSSSSSSSNSCDEEIWAYHNEGILVFETKAPFKLSKTIKTSYISTLIDEGESVWANCKEKSPHIKVISKNKYKTKKLLPTKTMDTQTTAIFINNSGGTTAPRTWIGTDKGIIFITEYPSLAPLVHLDCHNGGTIHSIKKVDKHVWTCSERVICVFDETGLLKRKIDGISNRVLSLLVLDNFVIGSCYDASIMVWDSRQNNRLVQHIKKKHTDAISALALSITNGTRAELWAGAWDKKITTYNLNNEVEFSSNSIQNLQASIEFVHNGNNKKRSPTISYEPTSPSSNSSSPTNSPRSPRISLSNTTLPKNYLFK
ncbi:hypothetical protein CYY_001223 [Polysphondylium violaceum]|uniref:Protein kinase domain-containing protein n=1 Tax=Polysphondylium violaceum TaxID=133409 RepID=A0A8J4Q1D6_9MYCE|nr:hypothetical protein CYY_001223 [Polysphondylium violaceum]